MHCPRVGRSESGSSCKGLSLRVAHVRVAGVRRRCVGLGGPGGVSVGANPSSPSGRLRLPLATQRLLRVRIGLQYWAAGESGPARVARARARFATRTNRRTRPPSHNVTTATAVRGDNSRPKSLATVTEVVARCSPVRVARRAARGRRPAGVGLANFKPGGLRLYCRLRVTGRATALQRRQRQSAD